MRKILIFTDSRGQHKTSFKYKKIFTEKIQDYYKSINIDTDLMVCPFQWTTTIDFIQSIEEKIINIQDYDLIILYTGIVEYSPRPLSNYRSAIMGNNLNEQITFNRLINSNQQRIFNNKIDFINKIIDKELLDSNENYNIFYKGENTKSIINFRINEEFIVPYLQQFDKKLIYINSNNIHPTWEGNYLQINPSGRPKNIYNTVFLNNLITKKLSNVIDISVWDNDDIKKYTVDNMHLTYEGSEWIYDKLINCINIFI